MTEIDFKILVVTVDPFSVNNLLQRLFDKELIVTQRVTWILDCYLSKSANESK